MSGGENHLSLQPVPGTDPALSGTRHQLPRVSERAGEERAAPRFPIWPCTRWGFPCLRAYAWSGGLLLHLFTLTTAHASTNRAVCFLWHYPSGRLAASPPACVPGPVSTEPRLRGIAPFGVRTFLPPAKAGERFSALPKSVGLYPQQQRKAIRRRHRAHKHAGHRTRNGTLRGQFRRTVGTHGRD